MTPDPYAPPKSKVADVPPVAPVHRVRTRWLYLGFLLPLAWVASVVSDPLLEALSLTTAATAVALSVLALIQPLRMLAARRDGNLPWYWDVLFLGMGGLFLLGVIREDTGMMFVGLVSSSAVIAAVVVAVWIFERRYGVRIYSKARGFVIVNEVKAS